MDNALQGWIGALLTALIGAAVAFIVLLRTLKVQRELTTNQLDAQGRATTQQLESQRELTMKQLETQRNELLRVAAEERRADRASRALGHVASALNCITQTVHVSSSAYMSEHHQQEQFDEIDRLMVNARGSVAQVRDMLGASSDPIVVGLNWLTALTNNLAVKWLTQRQPTDLKSKVRRDAIQRIFGMLDHIAR